MKLKQKVAILALAALVTGTSHAAITGKSSGFMDKRQLAEWRAETASNVAVTKQDSPAFFTGKPFLASTDTYSFMFRSYDPTVARWTTEDPSGFPDGPNGSHYAPNPTTEFDFAGLETQTLYSRIPWTSFSGFQMLAHWTGLARWSFQERAENSSVDPTPGFSGELPVGVDVNGIHVGTTFEAVTLNRSDYEYMTINGIQWTRYNLDIRVDIYRNSTANRTLEVTGDSIVINGHWYE